MNWHLLPLTEITQLLNTNQSGISNLTAEHRLIEYGQNQLEDKKKKTIFQMLLHQLANFTILILIAAAIISGIIGDITDTVIIFVIIILNATLGLIQEYRAENAMDALKEMTASNAKVIRERVALEVPATNLVLGNVIVLEARNIISPYIIGKQLGINAFVSITAILLGGLIWGFSGMILFLPFAALLKIISGQRQSLNHIYLFLKKT